MKKKVNISQSFEEAGETVVKETEGFCKKPSKLQLSMDEESFKRSPELYEHFKDGRFFSSVPACVFFGFSTILLFSGAVIIAYLIT